MSNKTYKEEVLYHICYTELAYSRINKKLGLELSKQDMEDFISKVISEADEADFQKRGKNIYVTNMKRNVRVTINSFTYRIITADKINRNQDIE